MKRTSLIGITLTLFMLLLVMVAAFVFLFQGRQQLVEQRDDLSAETADLDDELEQAGQELADVEATRMVTADALATAESNSVLLEGQLVESQQEVDALTEQLTAASETIAALQEEVAEAEATPPEVAILSPADGSVFNLDEEVAMVIVAADSSGITAVNLTIDTVTLQSYDVGDETLFTTRETWTPAEVGTYEIGVMAIDVNGHASEPRTITIVVAPLVSSAEQIRVEGDDPTAGLRAEIEANVSEIRGLDPIEPVTTTLLTGEELAARVEGDLFAEYTETEARNDAIALSAFDFIVADFELYDFTLALYSEQIAGFYDPETDEFVVVSNDDELDAGEQFTHAHEFVHALQDQHFNLDRLGDETLDDDASLAFTAFVEGEATLVQTLYLAAGYLDIGAVLDSTLGFESPVFDSAPPFLAESLTFPYVDGYAFVQALYDDGGFEAIDTAWANPPLATEHILHPDSYLNGDMPQLVTLAPLTDTLGTGWALADEDVLGEFALRAYLAQQLNNSQVDTAATGWGGDRYAVYWQEETGALVMVLRIVWDTEDDKVEFAALYPNYPTGLYNAAGEIQSDGSECWQGDDIICLHEEEMETTIIRAPDSETAVAIAERLEIGD